MIYISLSVKDFKSTIYFFTEVIGFFDLMGDSRLICNSGEQLIFDLYEIGTERHKNIFGIDTHAPLNISIRHDEGVKVKIIDRLKRLNISYNFNGDLGGDYLELEDPTGNKLEIKSPYGDIT